VIRKRRQLTTWFSHVSLHVRPGWSPASAWPESSSSRNGRLFIWGMVAWGEQQSEWPDSSFLLPGRFETIETDASLTAFSPIWIIFWPPFGRNYTNGA
jgi:hypothetical protein